MAQASLDLGQWPMFIFIFCAMMLFLYQQPIGKVVAVKQATPEKTTDVYNIAMRRPPDR